jgi:hypothetical protein
MDPAALMKPPRRDVVVILRGERGQTKRDEQRAPERSGDHTAEHQMSNSFSHLAA